MAIQTIDIGDIADLSTQVAMIGAIGSAGAGRDETFDMLVGIAIMIDGPMS